MNVESNGVRWVTVDTEGQEVSLHGRGDGPGLIVAAGSPEEGAGMIVLDSGTGYRFVAALLNLLDGDPVQPEALDLLSPTVAQLWSWWGTAVVDPDDGIRRGVMIANTGTDLVLCAGRVQQGGGRNTGAVAVPLGDARRVAEASLAILDGVDPWEVTG